MTMWRRRIAIFALAGLSMAGCRRRTVALPPPPATQVATTAPASRPADAVPAAFVIDGQAFIFPPAKLVAAVRDGTLRVTLFSDDPPQAVRDDYTGNSFYFRFNLDPDSADDLAGQQYIYRNSFTEKDDTSSGLFIAGGRQSLRPMEATVTFERLDAQMIVHVAGTFRLIEEKTAGEQPATVKVRAMLEPLTEAGR